MTVIQIDIISDIVCVWCYIGKRTLDKAIFLYQRTYPGGKNDIFSITWRPYYLNHNQPSHQSIDKSEAMKIKLSGTSPEKIAAMTNRVNQVGQSVGINFKFGGKIGSTHDAHRLIHYTQTQTREAKKKSPEIQNALVEKLFEAYHELEKDISDRDTLREIAVEAGLDGGEVDRCLNATLNGYAVDLEAYKNQEEVTKGVPLFIIQGVHRVDGAQDVQEFVEAFIKVKEEEEGG